MAGLGGIYGGGGGSNGGIVQFGDGQIQYDVNSQISQYKQIPGNVSQSEVIQSATEAAQAEKQAASARLWAKNALRVVNARVDLYRTHAGFQSGISRAEMRAGGIQLGHARVLFEKQLTHATNSAEYSVWQQTMGDANSSIDY